MGAFKEEAIAFETITKNSKRIYNDSADYGFPYKESDPPMIVQNALNAISELKASDKEYHSDGSKGFIRKRESWKDGVSITIRIAWEEDEGMYCGTQYTISFNRTKRHPSLIDKNSDCFMSVDIERYTEPAPRRRR